MREDDLEALLEAVRAGRTPVGEALGKLRDLPFADLGFATVDHHRQMRIGMPEVIFCAGKTTEEVATIAAHMAERGSAVLGTRCTPETFAAVRARLPRTLYNERGRVFRSQEPAPRLLRGRVAVVTAGTSDRSVAEEALETLAALGAPADPVFDVGVAGLHRLLAHRDKLAACDIQIVVAGMEGALRERRRRHHRQAHHRRADERRLRRQLRRRGGAPRHAEQLRRGRHRGQHRQWLRRGCVRGPALAHAARGRAGVNVARVAARARRTTAKEER